MSLQGWYVIQLNIEHVYLNILPPLIPPLSIHTYLNVFKNMVKYLCSLEPHYIIFSYGKQLICILEWTRLWWQVGEIIGKNLPVCPHSQLTPVTSLSTVSPAAFTTKCRWEKPLGEGEGNRNSWRSPKACSSLPLLLKFSFMCRFLWKLSPL